jgi:hypothetical protein
MNNRKNQTQCSVCGGKDLSAEELAARLKLIEEWQAKQMEDYGFYIHLVPDSFPDRRLINAHTHGLQSFGHLDLQLVLNIGEQNIKGIFHRCVELIKQGRQFGRMDNGHCIDESEIAHGYLTRFISAIEDDRPVWRLVVPDKAGNLDENKLAEPYSLQYRFRMGE